MHITHGAPPLHMSGARLLYTVLSTSASSTGTQRPSTNRRLLPRCTSDHASEANPPRQPQSPSRIHPPSNQAPPITSQPCKRWWWAHPLPTHSQTPASIQQCLCHGVPPQPSCQACTHHMRPATSRRCKATAARLLLPEAMHSIYIHAVASPISGAAHISLHICARWRAAEAHIPSPPTTCAAPPSVLARIIPCATPSASSS